MRALRGLSQSPYFALIISSDVVIEMQEIHPDLCIKLRLGRQLRPE
jgi:hypothetical protein